MRKEVGAGGRFDIFLDSVIKPQGPESYCFCFSFLLIAGICYELGINIKF